AVRLIHACGMPDIVPDLRWSDGAVVAARGALEAGAPVICDAQMVADGVIAARLPAENQVLSMIRLPNIPRLAREQGTTRSAAQVELWKPFLPGSVVAIGNAPTALFRLLEVIAEDPSRAPAAILGFPVGFVGAAESKDALAADTSGVPWMTLLGRRGGSAIASAAVNALAGRYET
ncbi:MAG: precorrin-8X methylmutase, partial [Alphaproteobacteria bacterium]